MKTEEKNELKMKLQKISLLQATATLERAGIGKENRYFSLRLYEMKFAIYEKLKLEYAMELI